MIGGGENLVELEDIFLFGLIGFQWSKAFGLESPLYSHLVGRVFQLGKIDGDLPVVRVEVATRNEVTDVIGVTLLRQLVVEELNPKGEGIVDTHYGLAWKEHPLIVTQELQQVN